MVQSIYEALDALPQGPAPGVGHIVKLRPGIYREETLNVDRHVTLEPLASTGGEVVLEGQVQFVAGGEAAVMRRIVVRGPVTVHE